MKKRILRALSCALTLCASLAVAHGQDDRAWTSSNEQFSVVGKLDVERTFDASNADMLVYIIDRSGERFQCPVDKLSPVDRNYLRAAVRANAEGGDLSEALAWLPDEKRVSGARRVLTVDGIEIAFRWVERGRCSEPLVKYDPNTLKGTSRASSATERAVAKRSVDQGFWIQETETTVEMYNAFVKETKYRGSGKGRKLGYVGEPRRTAGVKPSEEATWQSPGFAQTKKHPVVMTTFADAQKYCQWLSKKLGMTAELPTKAQWLLASQPPKSPSADFMKLVGQWTFGSSDDWERGNLPDANFPATCPIQAAVMERVDFTYRDSYRFTVPVGSFAPNANGLYDMIGNVGEIAQDYDDAVESLGGSWFHIQNFNPINWRHVNSIGEQLLDRAVREYAVSATSPIFASSAVQEYDQNYGGATGGATGSSVSTYSGAAYLYSPIEDVDATCFTGFRVVLRP